MSVTTDDRRVFDRFLAPFPVKFEDSSEDFDKEIFLKNVSAEGARFVSIKRVYLNDRVSILVKLPDGHDPLSLRGKVIWTQVMNPSFCHVGVRFEEVDLMNTQRIFGLINRSES